MHGRCGSKSCADKGKEGSEVVMSLEWGGFFSHVVPLCYFTPFPSPFYPSGFFFLWYVCTYCS